MIVLDTSGSPACCRATADRRLKSCHDDTRDGTGAVPYNTMLPHHNVSNDGFADGVD